ncbi:MAG: HsdR family type I site-specific deoxyribonuclease, partial [Campylobacterota bacterium]|nr:HsdR family type I site-specific deoxyribonuclease [Campylobacterota bacterium]
SPEKMKGYRVNTGQVLLKDVLLHQLQKLNSFEYKGTTFPFSPKNIANAIDDIDESLNEGLMTANQKISDLLMMGKSFTEEPVSGVKKSFSLNFIDFKNPSNNVFHFTEEFVVNRETKNEKEKTRRPDLVLFVNGIPFAVLELKKSSEGTEQGISQMIRNQGKKEIPQLFKFIQVTLAGNNHSLQYATIGTPEKFYAVWEEEDEKVKASVTQLVKDREVSKLDKTIVSLFTKERILSLMHSYIIFDGKTKKIARYQQYFAVEKIMQRVKGFDNTGRRAGGLIWHTQGSGKSLTMVMLAKVIKKEIVNSKIVIVTDRKNLDKQIHNTFNSSEVKAHRARSGHDLIELLQSGKPVITTIINKFKKVKHEKVVLEDPNIFIMVDEAHRTQNTDKMDSLHKSMKKVFPSACYLGFTGTPLMKKEKSSFDKFGGEIHRYTIDQAVRDKAVLPLLYEGRMVDQWVSDEKGLDRRFEKIAKHLNEEQTLDLKKKWARFQRVASSERRLEMVMLDINEHFKQYIQGTGFKAMLATSSKYEAIKYHKLFAEEGDVKTAFVISPPDTREGHSEVDDECGKNDTKCIDFDNENKAYVTTEWNKIIEKYGDEESYTDKIEDDFINGDEIELLIVVEKLLTGFDAPRASVLYIDRNLKEHNLLQAIARVNRLYDGKDFGFIIDYRGLLGDLDKALNDYFGFADFDEDDIQSAVFDIKDEIAKVKTYYSHLEELFEKVKNKNDQEGYQVLLGDEEKRKLFYDYLSHYARALKLALSSDKIEELFSEQEINNFRQKLKFYNELRKAVKIRYHEQVDFGKYEKQMQKLLDTFISADEVDQLTKLVNIFDEEFESEIERMVGDNARADAILSASTATIQEKMESNPAYYEKLSLRIKEIIEEYKDKRLSEEEKLKQAKDIRKMLISGYKDDEDKYPKGINSLPTKAFYDNIGNYFGAVAEVMPSYGNKSSDDLLLQVVIKIDEMFREVSKKPDWKSNMEVRKSIEGQVEELIWDLEDEYSVKFDNLDTILATIHSIGINNY